jgi:hypothetical protein
VSSYLFTTLFGYELDRQMRSFDNLAYIVDNSLPYLLMFAVSRDVRSGWWLIMDKWISRVKRKVNSWRRHQRQNNAKRDNRINPYI